MIPLTPAIDYNIVRKTIISAIMMITNLDQNHVITEEPEVPNSPRPTLPYMSMKITTPGAKFSDDTKQNVLDSNGNPTDNWQSSGQRTMSVSFHAYGRSHEEAYNYMTAWQTGLDLENIQQFLYGTYGISVKLIGTVADMSALLNTSYEGRSHLDCTFGLVASLTSNLGEIDSVQVVAKIDTDQTTVTETFTVLK